MLLFYLAILPLVFAKQQDHDKFIVKAKQFYKELTPLGLINALFPSHWHPSTKLQRYILESTPENQAKIAKTILASSYSKHYDLSVMMLASRGYSKVAENLQEMMSRKGRVSLRPDNNWETKQLATCLEAVKSISQMVPSEMIYAGYSFDSACHSEGKWQQVNGLFYDLIMSSSSSLNQGQWELTPSFLTFLVNQGTNINPCPIDDSSTCGGVSMFDYTVPAHLFTVSKSENTCSIYYTMIRYGFDPISYAVRRAYKDAYKLFEIIGECLDAPSYPHLPGHDANVSLAALYDLKLLSIAAERHDIALLKKLNSHIDETDLNYAKSIGTTKKDNLILDRLSAMNFPAFVMDIDELRRNSVTFVCIRSSKPLQNFPLKFKFQRQREYTYAKTHETIDLLQEKIDNYDPIFGYAKKCISRLQKHQKYAYLTKLMVPSPKQTGWYQVTIYYKKWYDFISHGIFRGFFSRKLATAFAQIKAGQAT